MILRVLSPDPRLVARFKANIDELIPDGCRLGIGVSGGPDSLALLLLAAAAMPDRIEAATVDHGLRPESAGEAAMVAALCNRLSVPHLTLTVEWHEKPRSNLQAAAREARYDLLATWARERKLGAIATAHHCDDQAETLLMRLARGSGVSGLSGIQKSRPLDSGVTLIRPLLGWRRAELVAIVDEASLDPVKDPSNSDGRFDRTRARSMLSENDWLDPQRLAIVAGNCRDAEDALDWAADQEFATRSSIGANALTVDPSGLPYELQRRLLVRAMQSFSGATASGPDLVRAMEALFAGQTTTLAGLKLEAGPPWRLTVAPPRKPRNR